jgi:hypothetical protein
VVVGRSLLTEESRPVGPAASPAPREDGPGKPLYGGSLEGGVRYHSLNLRPGVSFIPGDDNWFVDDTSNMFFLFVQRREPGEKPGSAYEDVLGGVGLGTVPTTLYDPDRPGRHEVPVQGNFGRFLDRFPDVETTAPRPTQVAGLDGYAFDLRVEMRNRDNLDRECSRHFSRPCVKVGPDFSALDGARHHVAVLNSTRGPFAVTIEGLGEGRFERLEGPANELISTLRIGD